MNREQCWFNHHGVISLVLATLLLALTGMPVLAWNDQGGPDYQPVRCWRVLSADQMIESDDCFGPERFSRFPKFIMQSQVPPQIARAEEMFGPDYWPEELVLSSHSD